MYVTAADKLMSILNWNKPLINKKCQSYLDILDVEKITDPRF